MRAKSIRMLGIETWAAAALCLGTVRVGAAWQGYLSLQGIKGEATERDHADWLAIQAFDDGVLSDLSYRSGGKVDGGQVTLLPLTLTRTVDRASPSLVGALVTGATINSGVLDLVSSGGAAAPGKTVSFMKIELANILVVGISNYPGLNGKVLETLRLLPRDLTYNAVKLTVTAKASAPGLASLGGSGLSCASAGGDEAKAGAPHDSLAGTTLIARNLLRNPGAEETWAAGELHTLVGPPGWTSEDGVTVLRHAALDGPGRASFGHGLNLFAGGLEPGWGKATQSVDLSAAAVEVDEGRLKAVLSGWLGSGTGAWDAARLRATFHDLAGEILGAVQVTEVAAGQADSSTPLRPVAGSAGVPPGTRSVEVSLELQRYADGVHVGLADDLSLTIEETQAEMAGQPLEIRVLRIGSEDSHLTVHLSWQNDAGPVVLESASGLEGPWNPESLKREFQPDETSVELPADRAASGRFWRIRKAQTAR